MAGSRYGTWWIPDVGDEVLVAFEGGNPAAPYVVGGLWNGQNPPPESMDNAGENHIKSLKTRSGVCLRINDHPGSESVELRTPSGQRIEIEDDAGGQIHITDTHGNVIKLTAEGIEIASSSKITLSASALEISAASANLNVPFVHSAGVLKCDTLQANSVVASSYTPGAGNIW